MKLRKILAGLLCAAMISTELLSATAFAADEAIVANSVAVEATEKTEDVQEIITPVETVEETIETEKDDEKIPEAVETVLDESNDTAVETNENEVLSESDKEEIEEAKDESTDLLDEDLDDSLIDDDLEVIDEEITDAASTELFEVDSATGTLKLKNAGAKIERANIIIPKEAKIIPANTNMFKDNDKIKTVSFEEGSILDSIKEEAFAGSAIETFTFPNDATATISEIEDGVFKGCGDLKTVYLNNRPITKIGNEAFSGTKLQSFPASQDLKIIGEDAFSECESLLGFNFNNVEEIGARAFKGCINLGKTTGTVTFTSAQRVIGESAFENCGFVELDMTGASNLGYDTDHAPLVGALGKKIFAKCTNLKKIKLPEISIDPDALVIPVYVTEEMFKDCTALTDVVFPEYSFGEKVSKNAFSGCTALVNIVLPYSVKTIDTLAFSGCTKLKSVEIKYPADDINISNDAFPINDGFTIYGYSEYVREFAQEHSFKYEDKSEKHTIKAIILGGESGTKMTVSPSSATVGQEVTVTVTPGSSNVLVATNNKALKIENTKAPIVEFKNDTTDVGLRLVSCSDTAQVFKFYMPYLAEGDTLKVTSTIVNKGKYKTQESVVKPELVVKPDSYQGFVMPNVASPIGCYSDSENKITFEKTGQSASLIMKDNAGINMGPWRFKYVSSDTNVCTVTDEGVITARTGTGKVATVDVTLKSTGKVVSSIKVIVGKEVVVDKMDFKFNNPPYRVSCDDATTPSVHREEQYVYTVTDLSGEKVKRTGRETFDYQLVMVPKSKVNYSEVKVDVTALFANRLKPSEKLCLSSKWTSGDTSVVKVASETSNNSNNTITIPKNATGEAEVRVRVSNDSLDDDDDLRYYEYGFIVRVIDDTPRLKTNTFTVNTYSTLGYELPIIVGYDGYYPIDGDDIWFSTTKDGSGNTEDIVINYVDGKYYVKESVKVRARLDEGKSVTYKNLYLCGKIAGSTSGAYDGLFAIPMGTITVIKKGLNPTVKLSGSINTFYDALVEEEDDKADKESGYYGPGHEYTGKVTLTQSLTSEKIEKYYLCTEANHKLIQDNHKRNIEDLQGENPAGVDTQGRATYDELQANFEFATNINEKDGSVEIYRTATHELVKDKNDKEVVSGYVYIKYKDFDEYVYRKITIPVKNSQPSYVLDVASVTAHEYITAPVYKVMLVDKSTKKLPTRVIYNPDGTQKKVDEKVQKEYVDLMKGASFSYSLNTTFDRFYEEDCTVSKAKAPEYPNPNKTSEKEPKTTEYNCMSIKVKKPLKATAYLVVKLHNWSKPVTYKFSLASTNKVAKAKASSSSVELNVQSGDFKATSSIVLDQNFATMTNPSGDRINNTKEVPSTDKNYKKYLTSENIKMVFTPVTDSISGKVNGYDIETSLLNKTDEDMLVAGKYSYTFPINVEYDGGKKVHTNKLTVTVNLKNAKPEVKLKTTKFTLNGMYTDTAANGEGINTAYSFSSLPSGYYELKTKTGGVLDCTIESAENLTKKPESTDYEDVFEILVLDTDEDGKQDRLRVKFKDGAPYVSEKFSYKFKISGVKAVKAIDPDTEIETALKEFEITVASNPRELSITQKTIGQINPVDPYSTIAVPVTIKNLTDAEINPAGVKLIEVDDKGVPVKAGEEHLFAELMDQDYYDELKELNAHKSFTADKNGKVAKNQIYIARIPDREMKAGEKYYYLLEYSVKGAKENPLGDFVDSDGYKVFRTTSILNTTAKQVIPGLSAEFVSPSSADNKKMTTVMYSGSEQNQNCLVRVTPKSKTNARVSDIGFTDSTNAGVKRAFKTDYYIVFAPEGADGEAPQAVDAKRRDKTKYQVYDINGDEISSAEYIASVTNLAEKTKLKALVDELQTAECNYYKTFKTPDDYVKTFGHYYVKVTLINPAIVAKNKSLDLNVEVKYADQMKKTTGSTFKLSVTVKK